jgi:membrane protein
MSTPESCGLQLLFEVSKRSLTCFAQHDMFTYAAALAYRALFALFPFFGFLIVLLGFFQISVFFEWLINQGDFPLDEQYAEFGRGLISEIQEQSQSGLLSSVGVIAVWSVSRGVVSLTKALNTVHGVEEFRPTWKRVLLQVFFALGLAVMIILGTALLLIGPRVVAWIVGLVGLDEVFIFLWTWLRLPAALVLLMLAVSIIYWVVPNSDHPFRLITPGAALAVIAWVIASLGFSFYLANFADYSVVYGSLGAAVALLLYFYISAGVLLLGAEVNEAIKHCTSDKHIRQEERRRSGGETSNNEDGSAKDV